MEAKKEYITPEHGPIKHWCRWSYGWDLLEVGEQMRCPASEWETIAEAQKRVTTSIRRWRATKPERKAKSFKSQQRDGFILVERTH